MLIKRMLAVTAAALAIVPSSASASERIQDGGFEGTTCVSGTCSNASWSKLGPRVVFCQTGSCSGTAFSGTHWLLFGGGFVDTDPPGEGVASFSMVEQQVEIPAAPAVLGFMLENATGAGTVTLTVKLDGTTILTPEVKGSAAFPYKVVTADVSQFAGPGKHNLRFEHTCGSTCGRVSVDDVSLDAADVPAPPSPPVPPVICGGKVATIVGTGQRETLRGTPGNDVIAALGGNDRVIGGRGNDVVCGGSGNDRLLGDRGRDRLLGQGGRDLLKGGRGRGDLCDGGDGKDRSARSCERVPA
jgi:hypothetical protein